MTHDRIATDRLLLRAWEESDAEALLATYSDDEVWPYLGAVPAPCPDLDAARQRAARWAGLAEGPLGFWAIETPGIAGLAPQPVGSAILLPLPRSDGEPSDAVEVGWALNPAAWGHGIATEAAQALLGRARDAGIAQVHAVVYDGNARSMALCDRLGMTRLGPTREWYGVEFVDHVLDL